MRLAIQGWMGYHVLLKPKHYLQHFHADYTPLEELEPLIEEAGFDPGEWGNLFGSKDSLQWDQTNEKTIGFPVLTPWMLVEMTDTTAVYERNPYYYKVDPAGNQLPYIDKIESYLVQDIEMVNMKIIAGEVDFAREAPSLARMPIYRENAESGGYMVPIFPMQVTPTDIHLNLTYEDEVWREVVRDPRFRQALNLALDKEDIIDTIYYGFAEPSVWADSSFDLEKANQLLDEMGMTIGEDGYRVGPDGQRFTIPFEIAPMVPDMVPLTELVVEMWGELGLHVTMRTVDSGLWGTRNSANELQATMIWTHTPLWYSGDIGAGTWAPLWNTWKNSNGESGEEPPEEVKELYDLVDQVLVSSPEEAIQVFEQVMQHIGDNLWYFNHIQNVHQPIIANAKLGNIPEGALAVGVATSAETFFYKE